VVSTAGGSGADAVSLGDAAGTLAGVTAAVAVNAAATDTLTFNDQGTAAARTYTVTATAVSWTGGPAVNYAGVGALALNGGGGNDTFAAAGTSATATLAVSGGGGVNTLVGSGSGNFWYLAGPNSGYLYAPAYGQLVFFAGVANLTAGSGGDHFYFADGASVSGSLAGGGADTLDYSAYTTSVVVDLALAAAGTDTGVGGTVSGITSVIGGSGAAGTPELYNLLIGAGGDHLQGGFGRRNVLVAGGAASYLAAGDGEDLLVGGSTGYDAQAGLASWQAVAAYWAGGDDFATRSANLQAGAGVPRLDATTVAGNGGGNTLSGNGGAALLYTDGLDGASGFGSTTPVTIAP
jgi:hypothetical protein